MGLSSRSGHPPVPVHPKTAVVISPPVDRGRRWQGLCLLWSPGLVEAGCTWPPPWDTEQVPRAGSLLQRKEPEEGTEKAMAEESHIQFMVGRGQV
jgi:hypothetical protein